MVARFIARLLAFVLTALPVQAQDGMYVGAFVGVGASPYAGEATSIAIRPTFGVRTETFDIGTNGATAHIAQGERAAFDIFLRPRFFALTHSDSLELAGIDRDVTLDAGLSYALNFAQGTRLNLSVAHEITGEHHGQEADLRLTQRFALGAIPLGVYAGAMWRSQDLSRYLYGVTGAEAVIGRPAFDPGATTSSYIGVNASLPVSPRVRVFGTVQADFLDPAITDSPIVTEDATLSLGVGIQFSF